MMGVYESTVTVVTTFATSVPGVIRLIPDTVRAMILPVYDVFSQLHSAGMKPLTLRRQARETLTDVSAASVKVIDTTSWATVALVAVAACSILALGIAVIALNRTSPHG
jgi:hypothetical protein